MRPLRLTGFFLLLAASLAAYAQTVHTSMSLTANPTSVYPGQTTLLTATVSVPKGAPPVPDGYPIDFYVTSTGAFTLGDLRGGVATSTVTPRVSGTNGGTASYTATFAEGEYPDPVYFGSSASVAATVEPIDPGKLQPGQYAFLVQGNAIKNYSVGPRTAAVGSLTLDGSGNVTGIEDVNSGTGASVALPVTGTLLPTVDPTYFTLPGVVTLTLVNKNGTQVFNVFLPMTTPPTTPTIGTLIEIDGKSEQTGAGAFGHGILQQQQAGFLSYTFGAYSLDTQGETACTDCKGSGHDSGPVAAGGQIIFGGFSGRGGPVAARVSQTLGSTVAANAVVSGSSTAPDPATGRFTFTLAPANTEYGDEPKNFVGYNLDNTHAFMLSLDPHSSFILLSGRLRGND